MDSMQHQLREFSEWRKEQEQTFQVGDLGRFSMRAIYDALATTTGSPLASRRPPLQKDPEDSDASWTKDDDSGTFYFDMQRKLSTFARSDGETTMMTAWLSKSQRRFVHATAQILRLGHASLGPQGKLRRMIVFKESSTSSSVVDLSALQHNSAGHDSANAFPSTPKKRRRLERMENGFPCPYCSKSFDRASERTKHETVHQPALASKFPCLVCGKAFRYPKDLRRHGRVHERGSHSAAGMAMGMGPKQDAVASLGSSFSSAPLESTLTADSRVPSDTSLTFSSNTVSKDVSPLLFGRSGGAGNPELDLDLEPFVLDENGWMGGGEDWLMDPLQAGGIGDGEDGDFLEMAVVRK